MLSQVQQLRDEIKTSSPSASKLINEVSSRLTEIKNTVSNSKGAPVFEGAGLWTLEHEEHDSDEPPPTPAVAMDGSEDRANHGRYSLGADGASGAEGGSAKWRIKALEARVAAQQDEIRELKAQLQERDQALGRLQQRNGVLAARLDDKDEDIAALEAKLAKLKRRLKDADSFAPRAWAVREAVQGGYGLEAAGLLANAAGATGDVSATPRMSAHAVANNWLHGDECDAAMVPGLEDFVRTIQDPSAAPLLSMVESFLQALLNKNPKMTDFAMLHTFLGAMENPFRSHKLWRDADETDLVEVIDALEAYILGNEEVFASIMASATEQEEQDNLLVRRMACLSFVQPSHLDLKKVHAAHPALTLARKMLRRISTVRAPQEMLECVFRAARIIFRMLNETSGEGSASADDFLPVLIYCVLKAGTPRLYTAIEYMSQFRRPSRLSGERHYYLVQLQTAVAFIEHMDAASLTIDAEEFHTKYAAAEQAFRDKKELGEPKPSVELEGSSVAPWPNRQDEAGVTDEQALSSNLTERWQHEAVRGEWRDSGGSGNTSGDQSIDVRDHQTFA